MKDDREQEFVVSYYVMEDIGDVYGISVEKYQTGTDYIEVEEIPKISESIGLVQKIAEKLRQYQVTPISLAESVDTMISMEEQNDKTDV